jgi:hypothetical protein
VQGTRTELTQWVPLESGALFFCVEMNSLRQIFEFSGKEACPAWKM